MDNSHLWVMVIHEQPLSTWITVIHGQALSLDVPTVMTEYCQSRSLYLASLYSVAMEPMITIVDIHFLYTNCDSFQLCLLLIDIKIVYNSRMLNDQ